MQLRQVNGSSMRPTLRHGQLVVFWPKSHYSVGDIVLIEVDGLDVIKRVRDIDARWVYIVGDNHLDSTDSRHYGKRPVSAILGSMIFALPNLPKATKPPKLVRAYGVWLGRGLAFVFVVAALLHLYRIDTFIPLLDTQLPGGKLAASIAAVTICVAEIFAIPFLLRMNLSRLGHLVSGLLVVIAPFVWVLLDLWNLGIDARTAQFGQFATVASSYGTLLLNVGWLAVGYLALYVLGFNALSIRRVLRKR